MPKKEAILECEWVRAPQTDGTEYLEVETYSWETWCRMCADGTIEDAKSVLVTARAHGYMTGWA